MALTIPGYDPLTRGNWYSWTAPGAVLADEDVEQTTRDFIALAYAVNELIPYMTPRAQAQAMNWIYQNAPAGIGGAYPGMAKAIESPGSTDTRYYQRAGQIPAVGSYSSYLASLPQGARAAHYGGAALQSWLAGQGEQMATSPYANAYFDLRKLGTLLEGGAPQTAGAMAEYTANRNDALAKLAGYGQGWEQLGQWLTRPQFAVPTYTPAVRGYTPTAYGSRGGPVSWWR